MTTRYFVRAMTISVLALMVTACQTLRPLTPEEVKSTFIGKPWHSPGGAFIFRENGTYTYKEHGLDIPRGTWAYEMKKDGTLSGGNTDSYVGSYISLIYGTY